jgi:hypothetical protein
MAFRRTTDICLPFALISFRAEQRAGAISPCPAGSSCDPQERPARGSQRPASELSAKILAPLLVFGLVLLSGSVAPLAQPIQPVGIFGDAVPKNPVEADFAPVTLGVKFWSSQGGTISGIRFYRGAVSPQGYVARLYAADGTLLGSGTMTRESGPVPGWQEADFSAPVPISANRTYVAAYYAPSGQYADAYYGLTSGATTGPLTAPASTTVGGNGVYVYANAFPQSTWEDSNYFVDVAFTATAPVPYLKLSFNPPNPSISSDAPLGSVVATITASWSDGSPFTGTLSFAQPYSNDNGTFATIGSSLVVNPSGPGLGTAANTTQTVTITATQ